MGLLKLVRVIAEELLLGIQAILLAFDDVLSDVINYVGQILEVLVKFLSYPMVKLFVVYLVLFIVMVVL